MKEDYVYQKKWVDPKEPVPTKQVMECITCKMPQKLIKNLDKMVTEGYHVSRSSFIRSSIRAYIKDLKKYE